MENALEDFREAVEYVVTDDKRGGLYLGKSSESFHRQFFENLVKGWKRDGIQIVDSQFREVQLFP
jgi:hypothetical protein